MVSTWFSQDKHCSREALLAGLKLEEQRAQSPSHTSSQYVHLSLNHCVVSEQSAVFLLFDLHFVSWACP